MAKKTEAAAKSQEPNNETPEAKKAREDKELNEMLGESSNGEAKATEAKATEAKATEAKATEAKAPAMSDEEIEAEVNRRIAEKEALAANGGIDVENYEVKKEEKHLYHVLLKRKGFNPETQKPLHKPTIQKFTPRDWSQFEKDAPFLGYSETKVIYSPESK